VADPIPLPLASPPVAGRERADARRNRERILDAATRLIEERGVDGVSMDEVAAEAGVGKGTLYRRFGDRSSLLRALIEGPETEFQNTLIRGAPPLGPGALPVQRLHAFGQGLLELMEINAPYMQAADAMGPPGRRYTHPVYFFYRTHLGLLLNQILGPSPQTEYLADGLMAPLAAEAFLHQRRGRGMSLATIAGGWHVLADAVVATAAAR
jgi:AcrR family transcriptional regulator